MNWASLIIGIICLAAAVFLFLRALKKHKKIDTCAYAYVERVQSLGTIGGKKAYAITYKVNANEPFKVLISPCWKSYEVGKKRMFFFEKGNAKNNSYFIKWHINYDKRFSPSIMFLVFGLTLIIQSVIQLIH